MSEEIAVSESLFDIGHWQAILIFALAEFRDLAALAQDEEVIHAHADKREILSFDENGESIDNRPETRKLVRKEILKSITKSRRTHLQLTLVYIVAVLERILDEFFAASFSTHPKWMHDYLRLGAESDVKGIVNLNDITSTKSREELIQRLAKRATDSANRGTFRDRLKRVEKLVELSLTEDLKRGVESLSSKRNRLVHELRLEPISEEEIESAFDVALDLLESLGRAAQKSSIPYSDPAHLLD